MSESKAAARKAGRDARKALSTTERELKSREICLEIVRFETFRAAKTVLLYSAEDFEVDVAVVAEAAAALGKRVAYPFCEDKTSLKALSHMPGNERLWKSDAFGMRSPAPDGAYEIDPQEIDFIVVPCVCFDSSCRRIGRGAGIYDRFLKLCGHAYRAGAAFSVQRVPRVPIEPHDEILDAVICEDCVYFSNRQGGVKN